MARKKWDDESDAVLKEVCTALEPGRWEFTGNSNAWWELVVKRASLDRTPAAARSRWAELQKKEKPEEWTEPHLNDEFLTIPACAAKAEVPIEWVTYFVKTKFKTPYVKAAIIDNKPVALYHFPTIFAETERQKIGMYKPKEPEPVDTLYQIAADLQVLLGRVNRLAEKEKNLF